MDLHSLHFIMHIAYAFINTHTQPHKLTVSHSCAMLAMMLTSVDDGWNGIANKTPTLNNKAHSSRVLSLLLLRKKNTHTQPRQASTLCHIVNSMLHTPSGSQSAAAKRAARIFINAHLWARAKCYAMLRRGYANQLTDLCAQWKMPMRIYYIYPRTHTIEYRN